MLFDSRPTLLNSPGRPGYPAYSVDIISPELPCGAAWLATALLELGIPLWRPWGIDDSNAWQQHSAREWQYQLAGSGWSRLVPSLVDGRRFRLRPHPVPRLGHHWPSQLLACPRRILFVRDPRDVLHSGWRREIKQRTIDDSLDPGQWMWRPHPILPICPAAYLSWFWRAWLAADDGAQVLVLRFEDAKRDPQRSLRRVLAFIDCRVGARSVARACSAARHEHAVRADHALASAGSGPALLAGGIAQEWRALYTANLHAAIGSSFDPICSAFGYAPGLAQGIRRDLDPQPEQLADAIVGTAQRGTRARDALLEILRAADSSS